jgi:hypothetical protein
MKKLALALAISLGLFGVQDKAFAATDTKNLTINASVDATASLTIGISTINFANYNPDTAPLITNTEGAVSVLVKVRTGVASTVTLTHQAAGPLTSDGNTIPINNVSWTSTGTGFTPGTMSSASPVSAGAWTGSGVRSGTFSYTLVNSWNYAVGSYTVTSTYTLTAP